MYVDKLVKIGIPVIIILLMLVIVGTGIVLARERDVPATTGSAAYDTARAGCWINGVYCPGPCGQGAENGYNPSGNYPSCCRGY